MGLRTAWVRRRIPCAATPAVPASIVLAAGILAGQAWRAAPGGAARAGLWLVAGGLVAAGVAPWRRWRLACLPLGFLLVTVHLAAPWDTLCRALPRPACRAHVRGVVQDVQCHGEALDCLPPPAAAMVRVDRLRLPGQSAWEPVAGRVLMLLPPGTLPAYGDTIAATGIVLPSSPPPFPRAFDYPHYLQSRGIRLVFEAHGVRLGPPAGGLTGAVRRLLQFRDVLASRLVSRVASETNAAVLLAMTFGFRQTMPAATREAFLRSGTIHVFSVSGLHVGIVAVVLGSALYLVGVPYRWRYGLLPVLLGAYVVMTGSAAPALRAWLMVCAISWAKALFLRVSPLNAVAFAAAVILLARPLALCQPGFLYSFATVAVLVQGWPYLSALLADLCERQLWLPRQARQRWRARSLRLVVQAAGASVLAWCGGAGLMLYFSAMLVPAALPVNAVLVPLAHALLALAVPKMLIASLPWALPDQLLGGLLDGLVELIRVLVTCGSTPAGSWSVPAPPLVLVVAYYGALFAALTPWVPRPWRGAALATATGVLVLGAAAPWKRPALALVWGADCDVPVVAVERPGGLAPVVVHSGTPEAFRALSSWLQLRGHRRVDAVLFGWDMRRAVETAPAAVRLLAPDTVLAPDALRPGSFLAQACQIQQERGARSRWLTGEAAVPGLYRGTWPGGEVTVELTPEGRRLALLSACPAGGLHLELAWDLTGRYRVTVAGPATLACTQTGIADRRRRLTATELAPAAALPCGPDRRGSLPGQDQAARLARLPTGP